MRFMMLVCWDLESMNAQTEPDPTDPPGTMARSYEKRMARNEPKKP